VNLNQLNIILVGGHNSIGRVFVLQTEGLGFKPLCFQFIIDSR
jgi:hypothetical protein